MCLCLSVVWYPCEHSFYCWQFQENLFLNKPVLIIHQSTIHTTVRTDMIQIMPMSFASRTYDGMMGCRCLSSCLRLYVLGLYVMPFSVRKLMYRIKIVF